MNLDEILEKQRTFLVKAKGKINANTHLQAKNTELVVLQGACHANLREPPVRGGNLISIATHIGITPKTLDIGNSFLEWVLDNRISPWKKVLNYGHELVVDPQDKIPVGVILPQETLESVPFNFIKNFCILLRIFSEKSLVSSEWYNFVHKFKLDPRDAFYLVSGFNKNGENYTRETLNLSGWHHPITDNYSGVYLDWNKYWTGNINSCCRGQTINGYFGTNTPVPSFSQVELETHKLERGTFNPRPIRVLKDDDLVSQFNNWKKANYAHLE